MPYCTLDDLIKLLPEETLIQLTDDEGAGEVNQARIDEAVSQADAEIDSYAGGRYGVPLSGPPDLIRKLSVDIALYHLYSRRVDEMPATRADRYKAAVRILENIAKGIVTLGITPPPAPPAQNNMAGTNKPLDTNVFKRDSLLGF